MSGHGVDDRDISAIEYLVGRLREETNGANKWDAPGVHVKVAEFKGQNLAITLERAFRNAGDPKATTPGAMHRSFTPPAPTGGPSLHPTPAEACTRCGLFTGNCHCTRENRADEADDPLPAHPRNPNLDARLEQLLAKDHT